MNFVKNDLGILLEDLENEPLLNSKFSELIRLFIVLFDLHISYDDSKVFYLHLDKLIHFMKDIEYEYIVKGGSDD